jgi:DNA modification methylase
MNESLTTLNLDNFRGKHFHADCFKLMSIIPDSSIDLILIDPPYEISKPSDGMPGGSWGKPGDKGYVKRPELDFGYWDNQPLDINLLCNEIYRILKPHGTAIVFYDIYKIETLKNAAENAKFKQFRLCHWQKTNPVPLNSKLNYLTNSREYFLTMVKISKPTFHSQYDNGVYEYPIVHGCERYDHPTQKPISLFSNLITKHSNDNDIIFDGFAGTATTAEASLITNRRFITCERDDKYYNIGCRRLKPYFNNKLLPLKGIELIDDSNLL